MRKLIVASFAVMLCHAVVSAQSFLYANNDVAGANTLAAFSVSANGALTPVNGSPYATGGIGLGGGYFASNRVTSVVVDDILYVANSGSNDITAFWIDPVSGILSGLDGSPFATGGVSFDGISLAATPHGQFLFVANAGASSTYITVFQIYVAGYLIPVYGHSFPVSITSLKISPNGKFLAAAAPFPGDVYMWTITPFGGLVPVPGSPFVAAEATGIDINCAGTHLYAGTASVSTVVEAFNIAHNGALSPIAGSPFLGSGINSNVALLGEGDSHLFVSNQGTGAAGTGSITAYNVAANGALSAVAGSPFPAPAVVFPTGLATDSAGAFLYAADYSNQISAYSIAPTGVLAPVPGTPFATGPVGLGLLSLTAFPGKTCP